MDALNPLGYLVSFVLGCFVAYVCKPFLGSYSARKGENLATKEDIAELTRIAEVIKGEISDNVWDRQRQWELRRDVVFGVIRSLADLDGAVNEFSNAFLTPPGNLTEEAQLYLKSKRVEAVQLSRLCTSAYQRAHTLADLAIHGALSRAASAYFQCAANRLKGIQNGTAQYNSDARLELAKLHNAVIIAARKELGVSEADNLPVLDYKSPSAGDDADY